MRLFLIACLLLLSFPSLDAQATSRGVFSGEVKLSSDPASVPCAGTTLLEEDFEGGLPADWTVVDGDGLTPRSELGLNPGWQAIPDYNDTSNTIMATPSWYANGGGVSNDWLITPKIELGSNSCLSWTAYSQDQYFPEHYEVYISTTTNDTNSFSVLADTVYGELGDPTIRAISLAAFAGDSVFIAFRQTSDDKFVLTLDEVRISEIEPLDIGVSDLQFTNPSPGDSLSFRFFVANYGSDTVTSFTACWSVDGGSSHCMNVDSVSLAPNQNVVFIHADTLVTDSMEAFLDFCAWTSAPNGGGDNDAGNDTMCTVVTVGSPVGLSPSLPNVFSLKIFPNPSQSQVVNLRFVSMSGSQTFQLQWFDLEGRQMWQEKVQAWDQKQVELDFGQIAKGIYLLKVRDAKGNQLVKRLMLN